MFNKALLTKQGWRLLQNPNSLTNKILKAKYFQQGSFLSAKLGSRPSFVWRSLLSAKGLLQEQEGLMWRVGDGTSIQSWKDRWLPTLTSYSVQSLPRVIPDDSTVSMLIDPDLWGWSSNLIHSIFIRKEAEVIVAIPLNPTFPPDRLAWNGTSNGIFSVQSAYHMGMEIQECSQGSTSQGGSGHRVWSFIWSLEVPNPAKLFMWRACNDLLPTRSNLARRKIVEDNVCPCYLRDVESGLHAIWSCPAAQDVWGGGSVLFQKCAFMGDSFLQVVDNCMDRFTKEDLGLMTVISRRIWLRRNKFIFENNFTHPQVVYKPWIHLLSFVSTIQRRRRV
jgi:hypothetical protein